MTRQPTKWIAAMLLFLMSGSVLATKWELVYENAGYREEVDRDSLNRTGQSVQAWDRLTPPGGAAADSEGFNYRYVLTWSDYDCANKRITAKRRIYIGDSARQVKEQRPIHQPVVEVKPGTPRAILLSTVCGMSPPQSSNGSSVTPAGQGNKPATAATVQPMKGSATAGAGQPQLLPNRREAELTAKSASATSASNKSTGGQAVALSDAKAATAASSTKNGTVSGQKQTSTNSTAATGKTSTSKGGDGTYRYLQNRLQAGKSGEIILTTSGTSVTTSKASPSSKSK